MNNKDNYKKALDQIHASEELKEKTYEKIENKKQKNNIVVLKQILATCAVVAVIFTTSFIYLNKNKNISEKDDNNQLIAKEENDLPRFKNMYELKEALKENAISVKSGRNMVLEDTMTESETTKSTDTLNQSESEKNVEDYSKTNNQVENVDEADIVKTDGEYIYYVSNQKIYIIKSNNLEIISKIDFSEESNKATRFIPNSIYINKDKIILMGNKNFYNTENVIYDEYEDSRYDVGRFRYNTMATALVYDISNKENPKNVREVSMDGYYKNSRMINDNIYIISEKKVYYYEDSDIKDEELLPLLRDSKAKVEEKRVECTDIAYFNIKPYTSSYTIVGAFNINDNKEANFETFYGADDITYSSENNLYLAMTEYNYGELIYSYKTTIYKFSYDADNINLKANCQINGKLNNQFSLDEYEGKLRVASTIETNISERNEIHIFDENLNEIGKIENLAVGEQIYSVRFMNKVGYVVTFKEIDPLFVIDLSNPRDPKVRGELKIPGYSSYLHPYDETHIIGIGNNTEMTSSGGVRNTNMKMSMFDVSDLDNPKEIFNINIGESSTYSNIGVEHKALFYNKEKDLIGFDFYQYGKKYSSRKSGYVIYKINLKENKFEEYAELLEDKHDYTNKIQRVIYIGNILYTLSNNEIISYDLETIQKRNEIELD